MDTAAPTFAPGSTFAGYRIESLAGRGGMGIVYRATQLALARPVALKLVASQYAADEDFRERFKREWETALKIIRGAWGSVLSRKESQHLYQPNGIVGLNGECMAIAFDTNTEKQGGMVEMVIMRFEDGKWRGVGYTMGAKAAQTPEGAPAAVSTTTSNVYPNNAKPVGPASTPAKSH